MLYRILQLLRLPPGSTLGRDCGIAPALLYPIFLPPHDSSSFTETSRNFRESVWRVSKKALSVPNLTVVSFSATV
jgi:hypothetical protein